MTDRLNEILADIEVCGVTNEDAYWLLEQVAALTADPGILRGHLDLEKSTAALLTKERDELKQDLLRAAAKLSSAEKVIEVAKDDFLYIAEQCESTARIEGVSLAEARTWKVVGRLSREAGKKLVDLSAYEKSK